MLLVPRDRLARRILPAVVLVTTVVSALAACTTTERGTGKASPSASASRSASPSASPSGSPSAAPLKFSDCASLFNISAAGIPSARLKKLTFSCGKLKVPLDYDTPSGNSISIEVLKIHYSDQTSRVGSLIMNPGGPGGSGVFLAISLAGTIEDSVLQHFDLVGFDPRGVGLSSPVRCQTDAEEDASLAVDLDVRAPAAFAQAKQNAANFANECTAKYGTALADYNTVETAKDMDGLRAAVGDKKINYLGFSYGTELGAVYAHLFPANIRVAVLDGAVDPTLKPLDSAAQQVGGFEDAFTQFAADCLTRAACKPLSDPRAALLALETQANSAPIPTTVSGDNRKATGGIVLLAALSALYSQTEWPALGDALIAAQKGDSKGLFDLADAYSERDSDGHFQNLLDVFPIVSCNDEAVADDPTDAQIQAAAATWPTTYPTFGRSEASQLFTCQAWQTDRHPVPVESAETAAPILVVGNLHDPATPYTGAVNLTKTLAGSAVLLSWDGEGHTSYGNTACIDDKVNAYLISATVPAAGITCPK